VSDPRTLDDLVLGAVAAPTDRTRRQVLADAVDDAAPGDSLVSAALRDDAHGPTFLAHAWAVARARQLTPTYRLLWAVVVLGVPAEPPAAGRDHAPRPATGRPRPAAAPSDDGVVPLTPGGEDVVPLAPGGRRVFPLTPGGDRRRVEPLTPSRPWTGDQSGQRWRRADRLHTLGPPADGPSPECR
jgi:hypothetical protein